MRDRRILIESNITSNVQTRVADSYATHPFREYFDRGLNVTLNTDNRLMSATTLTDEYVFAAEHLDLAIRRLLLELLERAREGNDLGAATASLGHRVETAAVVDVAGQDLLALSSVHVRPIGLRPIPL